MLNFYLFIFFKVNFLPFFLNTYFNNNNNNNSNNNIKFTMIKKNTKNFWNEHKIYPKLSK